MDNFLQAYKNRFRTTNLFTKFLLVYYTITLMMSVIVIPLSFYWIAEADLLETLLYQKFLRVVFTCFVVIFLAEILKLCNDKTRRWYNETSPYLYFVFSFVAAWGFWGISFMNYMYE